jgi:hypothetical protein
VPDVAPLDPERLLAALRKHRVRYVLIGALAARLYGFPRVTADADITPESSPENLKRLSAALRELGARIYTETIPEGLDFDCSPSMLARADMWNLVTAAGRVDIAFRPAGTSGFAELHENAETFEVFGRSIEVAALGDILKSKQAADRPTDREDVLILKEMLRRRQKG